MRLKCFCSCHLLFFYLICISVKKLIHVNKSIIYIMESDSDDIWYLFPFIHVELDILLLFLVNFTRSTADVLQSHHFFVVNYRSKTSETFCTYQWLLIYPTSIISNWFCLELCQKLFNLNYIGLCNSLAVVADTPKDKYLPWIYLNTTLMCWK